MTDRRSFLKSAGAAGLMAGPWLKSTSRAASPNDTVNVAVIGIRSRGAAHYKQFAKLPNVNVVTLRRRGRAAVRQGSERPRRRTEDQDRDRSAPRARRQVGGRRLNRHARPLARARHDLGLPGGQGCLRREARLAHHPGGAQDGRGGAQIQPHRRGRLAAAAATRPSRPRSSSCTRAASASFTPRAAWGFKPRDTIGKKADTACPPGVNYNLWLGPTRQRAFNENHFHYNWHWFWEYGCADLGNQGPHQMDIARWALGKREYPQTIKWPTCWPINGSRDKPGRRFAMSNSFRSPGTCGAARFCSQWRSVWSRQFIRRGRRRKLIRSRRCDTNSFNSS